MHTHLRVSIKPGTRNIYSGTCRNIPEHEKSKMQMTVMSEDLLLNSKYIKLGREDGHFRAFLTQPPLVIVCHELIIWRLSI